MNEVESRFSIKRVKKSSDADYACALKIYNETTAVDIKTSTNEITYWIEQPFTNGSSFELMVFVLYLDGTAIGFAMMCYIKRTKTVLIDYLAVYDEFRINAVLFPYLSLLQNYLNKNGYDVAYIVNEVSAKNKGMSINKESKMFKKLFCLEGFGEICADYYFPQLGLNNSESIFESNLYVKSNDNITCIRRETYLSIVDSIYKDYNTAWYMPFFINENDKNQYISTNEQYYDKICKSIDDELIEIDYMECPILTGPKSENTSGVLPTKLKSKRNVKIPLLIMLVITCPLFIIWLYTFVLGLLGVPIDAANTMIGAVVSASITSASAILLARRK